MTSDEDENNNVTPFPGEPERQGRRFLRAANDGGGKDEPALNLPPAVKALTVALLIVFLVQKFLPWLLGGEFVAEWVYHLGFVPARYTESGVDEGTLAPLFAAVSPVTHMFLHGGWLHLGINVLSLMAFGAGVEKWRGKRGFLLVFFGSGLVGALAQFALAPYLENPMIGASGAISGLFGALLIEMRARGHLGEAGKLWPFILLWIAISVFFGAFGVPGEAAPIAWATHVGGFFGGMLAGWLLTRARR